MLTWRTLRIPSRGRGRSQAEHLLAVGRVLHAHALPILEYNEDPLVSSDIVRNKHSSIFDSQMTEVNGNMIKVVSWYDNEAGYSARLADLAHRILTKEMAHA